MDKFEESPPRQKERIHPVIIINRVAWVLFATILVGPYLIYYFAFKPLSDPRIDWQPAFEQLWAEGRCIDAYSVLYAAHQSFYAQARRETNRFYSSEGCGYNANRPEWKSQSSLSRKPLFFSDSIPEETDPEWETWWTGRTQSWHDIYTDVFFGMLSHLVDTGRYYDLTGAVRAGILNMNCTTITGYQFDVRAYYKLRRALARVFAVDPERFETWDKNYLLPDWEQRYADCGEPALVFKPLLTPPA